MAIRRRQIHSPRPPAEYTPTYAARDAKRIAESMTLTVEPFDVEGLAASIGLKVQKHPLPSNISGFLRKELGEWVIGVNALHHPRRQRFTIAHELGHYFLHRDRGSFEDRAMFRQNGRFSNEEWEANSFAAMILIPHVSLQKMIEQRATISSIAQKFDVSELAAEFRIKNLGEERVAV